VGETGVVKALLPDSVRRRFDPAERYGLRLTLFAIALVLVGVPFGILVEQIVRKGPLLRVDTGVANATHQWVVHRGHWFVQLVLAVSWLGRPPFLTLMATIAAVYVWHSGRRRLAAFVVTTAVVGGLIDTAVKVLVNRPRPVLADPLAHAVGKSFPSGHAMSSTVVYGALLLVFLPVVPRRRRWLAVAATATLVLLIAASRIALGVHFLSDVLGGIVLGLAWLAASTAAFRVWRTERGRRPRPVLAGLEPEAKRDLGVGSSH
jgi:membrane-associated phospholipid phosphatase